MRAYRGSKSLGIDRQLIAHWIKEQEKAGEESFRGQGKLSPEQLESRRLKEENKRFGCEKKWLLGNVYGLIRFRKYSLSEK